MAGGTSPSSSGQASPAAVGGNGSPRHTLAAGDVEQGECKPSGMAGKRSRSVSDLMREGLAGVKDKNKTRLALLQTEEVRSLRPRPYLIARSLRAEAVGCLPPPASYHRSSILSAQWWPTVAKPPPHQHPKPAPAITHPLSLPTVG